MFRNRSMPSGSSVVSSNLGGVLLSAPLSGYVHQEPFHFYGGFSPYFYVHFLSDVGFSNIQVEKNGGFFRHYGAQSIRLTKCLNPKAVTRSPALRMLLYPIWLPIVAFFGIGMPFVMHYLDPLDRTLLATAGY